MFFVSGVFCQLDISEIVYEFWLNFWRGWDVRLATNGGGGVPDADTEIWKGRRVFDTRPR